MENPYIDLFERIKTKINSCQGFTDVQKTVIKVSILEAFADELQAQKATNEDAMKHLMQLLNNTVATMELSNGANTKTN